MKCRNLLILLALLETTTSLIGVGSAYAQQSEKTALKPRLEAGGKWGNQRSIVMTELWAPILQNEESVIYGDLRFMDDTRDNNEFNAGLGYRHYM
ncbi:MAG: hypothetical protein LRY69_04745, partial [Gammaproteobacteria bacterium]|nr:hypothetical protein [Gammaproteobacteria bacterium]